MHRRLLLLVWVAFVARGAWYCVQQPVWEGFDEWAHYAAVRHVAEHGLMPSRTDTIPADLEQTLRLLPLSQAAAEALPGEAITHDAYWRLPESERARREAAVRQLRLGATESGTQRQYEAQQPPLYYYATAPLYRTVSGWALPSQVLALRLLNVLVASLLVVVVFSVMREATGADGPALLAALLVACMPGLFIHVCRIGNDALAAVLAGAVMLACLRAVRRNGRSVWLLAGAAAGTAMLTKAYCLAFLPLLPLAGAIRLWRARDRAAIAGCLAALAAALLLAGWWYWGNWTATGTLSGEQLDVAGARLGPYAKLEAARQVNWRAVFDTALFSHIWVGGWSFLVARSWMYRVFEAFAVLAAVGVCVGLLRRGRTATALLTAAWCGMAFAVAWSALAIWQAERTSNGLGWYLYGGVAAEASLIVLGLTGLLGARTGLRAVALLCSLAAAFDLYTTNFILMPYHSGLIAHSGGRLASLRPRADALPAMFSRLAENDAAVVGPAVVAAVWIVYGGATLGLAALSWWALRTRSRVEPPAHRA